MGYREDPLDENRIADLEYRRYNPPTLGPREADGRAADEAAATDRHLDALEKWEVS